MTDLSPKASTSSSLIVIRPADPTSSKDINGISTTGTSSFSTAFAWQVSEQEMIHEVSTKYSVTSIQSQLANPNSLAWVAESISTGTETKNEIIGFVMVALDTSLAEGISSTEFGFGYPNPVELQRLYIHPKSHRTGTGQRLVQAVIEWAKKNGYGCVWLGVYPENKVGVTFYQRIGFVKIGSHEFKWESGKIDIDDIMVKRI